jgi:hypothetical protein
MNVWREFAFDTTESAQLRTWSKPELSGNDRSGLNSIFTSHVLPDEEGEFVTDHTEDISLTTVLRKSIFLYKIKITSKICHLLFVNISAGKQ